jgi:2-oxoglutarate/2-oxoacid ferredoxin oxidoreductase subunit alpha
MTASSDNNEGKTPCGKDDAREPEHREQITVRFAGDSGDGMQLTGSQFTTSTGVSGYDLATMPDFPAEIRAPAGSVAGVSSFQIRFSSDAIFTPGNEPDVLVAMNAAALKRHLPELKRSGLLVVNTDGFGASDLRKAGYDSNPMEDGSLEGYQVVAAPMTELTEKALAESSLSTSDKKRCKNLYALGLLYWLFHRERAPTERWLQEKFARKPELVEANLTALKAGHLYGELNELFQTRYCLPSAKLPPGTYRNIEGNLALAYGFVAAAQRAGVTLFQGSYPITPATDVLHHLSRLRNYGVVTFQAEDEIAAICSTIGAGYAGTLAVTTTSGPGLALKSEAAGLAVMMEVPCVIVDVQRAGPSTGLPTKTEQSDLMQAVHGRSGESPMPVLAVSSPGDAFHCAYEASRVALKYATPVIVLSDGYVASGAEPWLVPELGELAPIETCFITESEDYVPYARDPESLARALAIPGSRGLEHRIGGLEKANQTGHVSYDTANHHIMSHQRQDKIEGIKREIPPLEVFGAEQGDVLVVGWGSTFGSIREAVSELVGEGHKVAQAHLRWVHPLPADLGDVLKRFDRVLVPEVNLGQLVKILRAEYLVDAQGFNLVRGLPLSSGDIAAHVRGMPGQAPAATATATQGESS